MAHERKVRPRKALTRKDFKYKRDWRHYEEEEHEELNLLPVTKIYLISIMFIMGIYMSGIVVQPILENLGLFLVGGLFGFFLNVTGAELYQIERRKAKVAGVLVILASYIIFLPAFIIR